MNPAASVVYRDDVVGSEVVGRILPMPRPLPAIVLATTAVPLAGALALRAPLGWIAAAAVIFLVAGTSGAGRTHDRSLDWLTTPLLRAVEYATIVTVMVESDSGAGAATFAWLAPVVLHHYDAVYRFETLHRPPPLWRRIGLLGWQGRMAVAIGAASLGIADPVGYVCGALSGAILLGDIIIGWRAFFAGEREVEAT